jgi:hypothetical protein
VRQLAKIAAFFGLAALLGAVGGCMDTKHTVPPPLEYTLSSPYSGAQVIAIAPAINVSGSRDFDPLTVSDAMFSEMQQVGGLTVLPVQKTLAMMQAMHLRSIDSADTAAKLAAAMHADAILLISVTAYDPYMPPTVGMMIHLYTVKDPGEMPSSVALEARRADGSILAAPPPPLPAGNSRHLAAAISAVFNGGNQTVRQELHDFAQGRLNYDGALREDRYLQDADAYMRFVCHAMIRRLIDVERDRVAGR